MDFTLEVERSLRVLDGAVVVLDGSAGVQAQTLTVWKQANKFKLPCVFFVNKMDKIGADFKKSLDSIETKLNQRCCFTSIPIFEDSKLTGVIDLLSKKHLDLTNPKSDWKIISDKEKHFERLILGREDLFSKIADINNDFAEKVLITDNISEFPIEEVLKALRRSTLERTLAPVCFGTALRHTRTVKPVLDMVVDFLPSPSEKDYRLPETDLCGLVFKVRLEV